ncbi:hypothetical protein PHJA_001477400 [Phtheirospermum japonicum]|uniref:F-box domain-containing protein n=1 Tax=Phtheirospermum japonicum TaxID=374723 RepID=A0A830C0Y9_9LAMI|nr:hypothetical protein PHJA_001477400 [Phtheirospermum japonicum]
MIGDDLEWSRDDWADYIEMMLGLSVDTEEEMKSASRKESTTEPFHVSTNYIRNLRQDRRNGDQPPAPLPRHQSGGSLLVGMVGGNCYLRRCERKMLETNIDSLPDDILFFNILTRLPAQDIYNAPRVVCRKWYQMIHTHNFVYAHLRHSTCGLLIRNLSGYAVTFMTMTQGQIEISKFSYNFGRQFWSSCNGLMLEANYKDNYDLLITNPVTKQHFVLPPIFARTQHPNRLSAKAHAAAPMQYKVVRTCYLEIGNQFSRKFCAILTVGVDNSWRVVDTQHLSLTAAEHFSSCPLVTKGFVHWARGGGFVLTLDVETEIITQQFQVGCLGDETRNQRMDEAAWN